MESNLLKARIQLLWP